MKRAWLLSGVLSLAFGSVGQAVTLSAIQGGNLSGCGVGCYQIGDKQFTNIQIIGHNTANEGAWTEANVDVSGSVAPGGIVSIFFNLPAFAGLGSAGPFVDFALLYDVATTGGLLISEIEQRVTGTAGLNDGLVQVSEKVSNSTNTELLATSNVVIPGDPNDPNPEANDVLVLSTPVSSAKVRKDILILAGSISGAQGVSSVTLIQQSFHQVPEPGQTALLLGSFLIVGLYFKSRKRAQA